MAKQYKNLVNGEWKLSENEIKIYAPATGEELGSVPAMSREEVDQVYASARAALADWRALSYVERMLICTRLLIFWCVMLRRLVLFSQKRLQRFIGCC
ncbi:aldehyde dehydrogenase family protein [Streptococcus equi]|uniref:aldehyde dehydrogenase family protein n=1 Tax=Streptococcus equi TaxID=1336 RepID=UPI0020324032|nr:aldehyde dehydrogenase family protein [Streptococcus equi]